MIEIWKDIIGYEGIYQISSFGRVKSLDRKVVRKNGIWTIKERILKQKNNDNWYLNSVLHKEGKQHNVPTHHLVAIHFLNHIPSGFKYVINHINLNKHDNRLQNLEIITTRQNCSHKKIIKSSQYTGVCWNRFVNKWHAQIKINGKSKYLGYFINEIDAHKAYQEALKNL